MPDVEFGREFGAGVVDANGDPAAGWRFQLALARGSTEWLSITLADGTLASDGVLALDAEGLLPVAFASIPGDDVPGELWAHRVGAPLTEGWYRVRLPGDGITTSGGGQDGEDGTDGKDGMTILRFRWEAGDNPAAGDRTRPFIVPWGASIKRRVSLILDTANTSGTPAKVTLLVNNVDVIGADAPTVTTGSTATVDIPAEIAVPAGAVLQAQIVSIGATSSGTVTNPTPAADYGVYASGVGGAPVSGATSMTVPLPAGASEGDLIMIQAYFSTQPSGVPSGWNQAGTSIVDSATLYYSLTYTKIHATGDTAPTFSFAASSHGIAVSIRMPSVDPANSIDAAGTSIVNAVSATSSTPTVTTDSTTTKETAIFTFGARYPPAAATTLTITGGPTTLLTAATNRGATSPNIQVGIGYTDLDAAGTTVPAANAAVSGGQTTRWLNRVQTIRPLATASSGGGLSLDVPAVLAGPEA